MKLYPLSSEGILPKLSVLLLFVGCCHLTMEGGPVNLEPNDPRPIVSLEVADADEAELLVQQFGLEVVRVDGGTVFFYDDADMMPRLEALGYQTTKRNPYDVFRRVVRIDRSVSDKELVAMGLRVINREESHLIVEGNLGQLRALVRGGTHIAPVADHEPRPRQIRIEVRGPDDVRRIGALGVDIYNAKPEPQEIPYPSQTDQKRRIVIYGAAFDDQIDQVEDAGYSVEILPQPTESKGGNPA